MNSNNNGVIYMIILLIFGIIVNRNAIPNDLQKPFVTSGLRLGSPALTTRGFKELEFEEVAILIDQVLKQDITDIKDKIKILTNKFPIYR